MAGPQPQRRPRARRLSPDERRASLVEAGVHVFARRGIGAARPSEVAEEAGVSEATVYVYFPNREALVEAVLDEVGGYYVRLTEAALAADRPLAERLGGLLDGLVASVDADPDHARVWFNWGSAIRGEVWPRFLETEQRLIRAVESAFRDAAPEERERSPLHPVDLARLLIGAGERVARMKFAGCRPAEVRRFIRSTRRLILADSGDAPGG